MDRISTELQQIENICNNYENWTDAKKAICEIKMTIVKHKQHLKATKRFFAKTKFGWRLIRDNYQFNNEEKTLAIQYFLDTGIEP